MTDATVESAVDQPGAADMFEIFYAPRAVFTRRRASGAWFVPYLVLLVLGIVIFIATRNLIQPAIDAQVAASVAQAQAHAKVPLNDTQITAITKFTRIAFSILGVSLYYLIAPFVIALLVWIVGMICRAGEVGRVALVIAVFSIYPRLIGSILGGIQAAVLPDTSLTSLAALTFSPARFLPPTAPAGLVQLLSRLDLFTLWGFVLIALGLRYAAGASRGRAWTTAGIIWLIGSLGAILALLRGT